MFTNILVGVDRHQRGRDAIALSSRLLAPGGELTLAHVFPGDARTGSHSPADRELAARERAVELLETARREADVRATLSWRESSSVGRGLHELCERIGADLLVVGSCRRGLLGRVMIGDDVHAALDGAPCAIAIAPAGYGAQAGAVRQIGVAYNGSPESDHALAVARAMASQQDAKLSALEAVSIPSYAFAGGPAPIGDTLDALMTGARERLAALEDVEARAVYGNPVEELSRDSATLDLLVVGSRGYGPVGRLVHGSTARQLAGAARCPLLVLTRGAPAADQPDARSHERELTASVPT